MKPWWKLLVVPALVLPIGGYVGGSLAAGSVDDPAPRAPLQLAPAAEDDPDETGSPAPGPTDGPVPVRPQLGDDRGGPPSDHDAGDGDD